MTSNRINNLRDPSSNQDAATKSYVDTSIPVGGIIMWSGTTGTSLPSNWRLCDGSTYNGITTPDLRGRFVLSSGAVGGLTTRIIGQTGGAEMVTLDLNQIPSHNHTFSGYTKQITAYCANGQDRAPPLRDENHSTGLKTEHAGGSLPHENMPPFYVLAFIMRIS